MCPQETAVTDDVRDRQEAALSNGILDRLEAMVGRVHVLGRRSRR
ncbi:hypothetical protein ACP4OV_010844 [Aristida adscensionis]